MKFNLDFDKNSKFQRNSSWCLGRTPYRVWVVQHFKSHFLLIAWLGSAAELDHQHSIWCKARISAGMTKISEYLYKINSSFPALLSQSLVLHVLWILSYAKLLTVTTISGSRRSSPLCTAIFPRQYFFTSAQQQPDLQDICTFVPAQTAYLQDQMSDRRSTTFGSLSATTSTMQLPQGSIINIWSCKNL